MQKKDAENVLVMINQDHGDLIKKSFQQGLGNQRQLHVLVWRQNPSPEQRMRIAVRAVNSTSPEAAEVQRSFISKAY